MNVDRERLYRCLQCGAGPGMPCTSLSTRGPTKAGTSIVPSHSSRKLAAKGLCVVCALPKSDHKEGTLHCPAGSRTSMGGWTTWHASFTYKLPPTE